VKLLDDKLEHPLNYIEILL